MLIQMMVRVMKATTGDRIYVEVWENFFLEKATFMVTLEGGRVLR